MITVPVKLTYAKSYGPNVSRYKSAYTGRIPSSTCKYGSLPFRLCYFDFNEYFDIPEDATDIRLIVTKSANKSAYRVKQGKGEWGNVYYMLDGFVLPGLYTSTRKALKELLSDGYKYVRFDYKVA